MGKLNSIEAVIAAGLCISCGACVSAAPGYAKRMVLDSRGAIYLPELSGGAEPESRKRAFLVCPGKGLQQSRLSRAWLPEADQERFELGRYRELLAVRSSDPAILKSASSGGVMTELARYLLKLNIVSGVTGTRFVYGKTGPRVESFIVRSEREILASQGSKYCPTMTNVLVRQCQEMGGRYLFVGVPCQVAALRLAMEQDPSLKDVFIFTLSNFCGGYRDYRSLNFLLQRDEMDPAAVAYFQFRGDGQPGRMIAMDDSGKKIDLPYPDYMKGCPVPKAKRCVYCVDATGELADFSCGDAWLPRFRSTGQPWSILITRSKSAQTIFQSLQKDSLVESAPITPEEVIESQSSNLESKKYRQFKRMRVSRCFGVGVPEWDVALPSRGSYLQELRILVGRARAERALLRGRI